MVDLDIKGFFDNISHEWMMKMVSHHTLQKWVLLYTQRGLYTDRIIRAVWRAVTFTMHQFWKVQDPMAQQMDMAAFMKNISMIGAALMITYFGSGVLSIDNWLSERTKSRTEATPAYA